MLEKIFIISDLITYQEGSIVSREIIKKPTGNVTLFAFSKGQGLSEHMAPFDALMYVIDGSAEIKISEEVYKVGQGQMVIAPANKPHELKAVEKFKMMLLMLKS
ncbi:MAG: cupin domain-containing protein [bacterium]|nr:cupin domain-containing protein [bacterium]